ncbi:ribonuclease H-like domain-containing protein [Tanacetum coccineum]
MGIGSVSARGRWAVGVGRGGCVDRERVVSSRVVLEVGDWCVERKVSHPNGTESLITKVGNLVLTKFLTLYDVLVVPEYCVTLVSVHNVARENKFIVGFDESKCFLIPQDLMDLKVMGIGKQVNGLYDFDNIEDHDQSILQNDLSFFENKTENMLCDICQKAKQTREPFPLSEHKSIVLVELVHLDLWGPYKVVSKEGHRTEILGDIRRDFAEILISDLGSNGSASENEMATTTEHESALSEGDDPDILTTKHVQNDINQPLRRRWINIGIACKDLEAAVEYPALLVYVDDIIVTGSNILEIEKFKEFLKSRFMIKDLGKLKYFLGIKVGDTDDGICLSQRKYCLDLLSDFGLLACKPFVVPLEQNTSITSKSSDSDPVINNITEYQKLIGKLIYLTHTRPDISYSFHCLSQFMHKSLKSHIKIALKLLRYLKGSLGEGIHISKNKNTSLEVFVDADWAKPAKVFCDSQAAIKIAANPVFHERTKHLEIDLHFVRDKIISGVIETKNISTADQITDVLTKGLDKIQHDKLVLKMGMIDVYQVQVQVWLEVLKAESSRTIVVKC